MNLTANYLTSRRLIDFTCIQCGYRGSSEKWAMTCPRCWVPMAAGTPETWWAKSRRAKETARNPECSP